MGIGLSNEVFLPDVCCLCSCLDIIVHSRARHRWVELFIGQDLPKECWGAGQDLTPGKSSASHCFGFLSFPSACFLRLLLRSSFVDEIFHQLHQKDAEQAEKSKHALCMGRYQLPISVQLLGSNLDRMWLWSCSSDSQPVCNCLEISACENTSQHQPGSLQRQPRGVGKPALEIKCGKHRWVGSNKKGGTSQGAVWEMMQLSVPAGNLFQVPHGSLFSPASPPKKILAGFFTALMESFELINTF